MNMTRIIAIASVLAIAGAGQASAGGLLGGLGILNNNKTGGIVIAPSVGVGEILSDNDNNKVLNGVLNGTLSGVLNGTTLGILGGSDCGCKKRKH
jgi:TM2 domain-containing membrane protein YozV